MEFKNVGSIVLKIQMFLEELDLLNWSLFLLH